MRVGGLRPSTLQQTQRGGPFCFLAAAHARRRASPVDAAANSARRAFLLPGRRSCASAGFARRRCSKLSAAGLSASWPPLMRGGGLRPSTLQQTQRGGPFCFLAAAHARRRASPVDAAANSARRAFLLLSRRSCASAGFARRRCSKLSAAGLSASWPPLMRVGGLRPSTLQQTQRGGPFCFLAAAHARRRASPVDAAANSARRAFLLPGRRSCAAAGFACRRCSKLRA